MKNEKKIESLITGLKFNIWWIFIEIAVEILCVIIKKKNE